MGFSAVEQWSKNAATESYAASADRGMVEDVEVAGGTAAAIWADTASTAEGQALVRDAHDNSAGSQRC
ncbi:hypothetical protein ACQPWW_13160 [Micromonospora sp. CA-240977]|uniref:hypothetical protein n=1 Tax=Micromonospora sp. CA-240977 TaxID=3239957 RepID=UPI003D8CE5C5